MNSTTTDRSTHFERTRRAVFITPLVLALASLPAFVPASAFARTVGSGKAATETRNPGEFQSISSSGSFDIVVRQGAASSVQVSADDNLLPLLETSVESGGSEGPSLRIRWRKGENISHRSHVTVTVVTPKLTALTSNGSGDIRVEPFQTPALQLRMSGSGDAKLDGLKTDELGVRISGSGSVGGKGSAQRLKVAIAGSGDVKLMDLQADEVAVNIAGSGDAAVHAARTLAVSIAGSGDVVYSGEAKVSSSIAGSGSVHRK